MVLFFRFKNKDLREFVAGFCEEVFSLVFSRYCLVNSEYLLYPNMVFINNIKQIYIISF